MAGSTQYELTAPESLIPEIEARLRRGETANLIAVDLGLTFLQVYRVERGRNPLRKTDPGYRRHYPQALRDEVAGRLLNGQPYRQIRDETGAPFSEIARLNKALGRPRRLQWFSNDWRIAALERIAAGETITAVAEDIGACFGSVWAWVQAPMVRHILEDYRGRESLIRKLQRTKRSGC